MGNPFFRFKKFTVRQDGAAMKVGTDGVLIGAWARLTSSHERYLDIGAGTGLIALMLAQRTEGTGAKIDAVEIDNGSYIQALENIKASEWGGKISAFNLTIQEFAARTDNKYHHIVANPPYFVNSLLPHSEARSAARHTSSLSYSDLLSCVSKLLTPEGVFSVIIPSAAETTFMETAAVYGLYASRKCLVFPLGNGPAKRVMLEFSHTTGSVSATSLVIETGPAGEYTPEYRELTRDFYLKF
jgi:Predicted O-methyltransferase